MKHEVRNGVSIAQWVFHAIPATNSTGKRPPIPRQTGHQFHGKTATLPRGGVVRDSIRHTVPPEEELHAEEEVVDAEDQGGPAFVVGSKAECAGGGRELQLGAQHGPYVPVWVLPVRSSYGYSTLFGRLFQRYPAADSGVIRPPIPGESGHPPPGGSGG